VYGALLHGECAQEAPEGPARPCHFVTLSPSTTEAAATRRRGGPGRCL